MVKYCPICGARNRSKHGVCMGCRRHRYSDGDYVPSQDEIRAECDKIRQEHLEQLLASNPKNLMCRFRISKIVKVSEVRFYPKGG